MTTTSQAIQNQIAQAAADLNKQIAVQNLYSKLGTQGIDKTYKGLDKSLRTNLNEIVGNVNAGSADLVKQYNAGNANIDNSAKVLEELLGNTHSANRGPLAEVERLRAEQAAAMSDSNASYNMLGTGHINAGQMAIGDAAREGASAQTDLRSQIGAEIGELQRTYAKERSAMEVQYAQVLAEERYRAEQMALERARLASENAARAAAAKAAEPPAYKGREGLLAWAAANNVPKKELDAMLAAISKANQSGDTTTAYNTIVNAYGKSKGGPSPYDLKRHNRPLGKLNLKPGYNLDRLNAGLDIYYGNYASYQ